MRLPVGLRIRFLPTIVFLVGCGASNRRLARQSLSVAEQVKQMAGCYLLVEGGRHLPEGFPPSPVILLDSVPAYPDESPMLMTAQVLTPDSAGRPVATFAGWTMDATHSNLIHLWVYNDFEGSGLTLTRSADTLAGNVRRFVDFPKVSLTHRARAVRVRCSK